ncbi:hypothetical protein [Paraburkholderia tropica]|uniref:hypothetical protein n=1 Tax=Paraburkholderia tropica TaxID=92647 RepID=UPI002AB6FB88|nr:hypothetical protein [Paraburkholderia tropica]
MNAVTMDSLPAISDARLPESYTNAVNALEQATAIDECQAWADKAMALASYARQSRDDRLHRMAMRIQARATRRCGELLHQVPRAAGRPPKVEINKAARTNISREQVATDAGMSKHQRVTALRVASVPKAEFERQVESTKPPTVTALADQGRKTRVLVDLEGIPPEDFRSATELMGLMRRLTEFCRDHDALRVAAAFKAHERPLLRENIAAGGEWLRLFVRHLPE